MTLSANGLFRILAAAAFAAHLFLWLAPLAPRIWPEAFDVWLLDLDGTGGMVAYHPALYWCLLACWLLVLTGLFFYVAAARPGFIALVAVSVALELTWGIRVLMPFEAAVGTLSAVIDGAVIVMSYSAPVHEEFLKRR